MVVSNPSTIGKLAAHISMAWATWDSSRWLIDRDKFDAKLREVEFYLQETAQTLMTMPDDQKEEANQYLRGKTGGGVANLSRGEFRDVLLWWLEGAAKGDSMQIVAEEQDDV